MILCFLHSENTAIIARGIDLFVVASCCELNPCLQLMISPGQLPVNPLPSGWFHPGRSCSRSSRALSVAWTSKVHTRTGTVPCRRLPNCPVRSVVSGGTWRFIHAFQARPRCDRSHDGPFRFSASPAHGDSSREHPIMGNPSLRSGDIQVNTVKTGSNSSPLDILLPALVLLHHLVFPPPHPRSAASQAKPDSDLETTLFSGPCPQGVDLRRRLQETGSTKEFNGVQHVFVTALGSMACADIHVDDLEWATMGPSRDHMPWKAGSAMELNTVQCEL